MKRETGCNIVMTHVGADLLLRKCYNPGDWHHHITVVDKNGTKKQEPTKPNTWLPGVSALQAM